MNAASEHSADDGIGEIIASTAAKIFEQFGAVQNVGARAGAEQGLWNEPAWAEITAAGFTGAMLPESYGGIEISHALRIIRLAAAQALGAPLAETMAANWLLVGAGLEPAPAAATFTDTELTLAHEAGGWRAQGVLPRVPWGRACDIVALARTPTGAAHLIRINHAEITVTQNHNIAAEPRDDCFIDSILPAANISLASRNVPPSRLRCLGAALRAVQMAGALDGVLAMTAGYARDRQQFGRPLAGFQAIQQLVAGIATQTAAAGVAADMVAEAFSEGVADNLDAVKIAAAKIRTGEAAGIAAAAAHQIHGAIGFTREYPLNLLTRRLWAWRDEYGGESEWSILLGPPADRCRLVNPLAATDSIMSFG